MIEALNLTEISIDRGDILEEHCIIVGGARGADTIAQQVAENLGISVKVVKAEWDKYGKSAGPIRNQKMLEMEPDLVIAFMRGKTKGTMDMIKRAREAGIPRVCIFDNTS